MTDPLNPPPTLLIKLGSAAVHAAEFLAPGGHPLDKQAFEALMADHEVVEWLAAMDKDALLPLRRDA